MKKYCRFFTLVELLAVIAILSILGAIGFGSYSYANSASREAAAKSIITQISAALETVKKELGYYPSTKRDWEVIRVDIDDDVFKISFDGNSPKESRVSKIIAKAVDIELLVNSADGDKNLCDPWGGKIYYRCRGKVNTASFDLLSAGTDGKFGTGLKDEPGDDWNKDKFMTNGEIACDDITNF